MLHIKQCDTHQAASVSCRLSTTLIPTTRPYKSWILHWPSNKQGMLCNALQRQALEPPALFPLPSSLLPPLSSLLPPPSSLLPPPSLLSPSFLLSHTFNLMHQKGSHFSGGLSSPGGNLVWEGQAGVEHGNPIYGNKSSWSSVAETSASVDIQNTQKQTKQKKQTKHTEANKTEEEAIEKGIVTYRA